MWEMRPLQEVALDERIVENAILSEYSPRGRRQNLDSFGIGQTVNQELVSIHRSKAVEMLRMMMLGGVSPIDISDSNYPANLRTISDPPRMIYHLGVLYEFGNAIAVSGTREACDGVLSFTRNLCRILAGRNYTIVSGLARGVDTSAHLGALDADGGTTVAVIASELRNISPAGNMELARRIASRGAILSEKGIRTTVAKYDFIHRNRIISGISRCQIIMESSGAGGSEHQFKIAREQGRPVFVYDGEMLGERGSAAARGLIERGGIPFRDSDDLLGLISSRT